MIPVRNPPPPFPRSKLFHNKLTLPVVNAELGLRCFGGDKFSKKELTSPSPSEWFVYITCPGKSNTTERIRSSVASLASETFGAVLGDVND